MQAHRDTQFFRAIFTVFKTKISWQLSLLFFLSALPATYLLYDHKVDVAEKTAFSDRERQGIAVLRELYQLPSLIWRLDQLDFQDTQSAWSQAFTQINQTSVQVHPEVWAELYSEINVRLHQYHKTEAQFFGSLDNESAQESCNSQTLLSLWNERQQAQQQYWRSSLDPSRSLTWDHQADYLSQKKSIDVTFLEQINCVAKDVINHSNLILDSDVDTYYVMEAAFMDSGSLFKTLHAIHDQVVLDLFQERSRQHEYHLHTLRTDLYDTHWLTLQKAADTAKEEDHHSHGIYPPLSAWIDQIHQDDVAFQHLNESLASLDLSDNLSLSIQDRSSQQKALDLLAQINQLAADVLDIQTQAIQVLDDMILIRRNTVADEGRQVVMIAACFAILCSAGFLWSLRQMYRKIRTLTRAAKRVAEGNLQVDVLQDLGIAQQQRVDELGFLGQEFDLMVHELRRAEGEVATQKELMAQQNANLEQEIAARTASMRMILDNVMTGFFLLDRDLRIAPTYTKSCYEILRVPRLSGESLQDVLRFSDEEFLDLGMGLEQFFEDLLDESMLLEQIPNKIQLKGRNTLIRFAPTSIREGGEVAYLLVTVSDITELERIAQKDAENTKMISILQQKSAFKNLIKDIKRLLQEARTALGDDDDKALRRALHTIKGNSAVFSLDTVVHTVHEIEAKEEIVGEDLHHIERTVRGFLERFDAILQIDYHNPDEKALVLRGEQVTGLYRWLSTLERHVSPAEQQALQAWSAELSLSPFGDLLGPVEQSIQRLAKRLNKEVSFVFVGKNTPVDAAIMAPICQNLEHLIRNSLDHGIETPDEREKFNQMLLAQGSSFQTGTARKAKPKPLTAQLELRVIDTKEHWQVILRDDGRGIDGDRVATKALREGKITAREYQNMSFMDKVQLILLDGFSTAEQTTDISGRGVGMAAVHAAVVAQHGTFEIQTALGIGTSFVMTIPKYTVKSAANHTVIARAA